MERNRHLVGKGFALVVTLSLMILLTVIAVGLLSLSALSIRSSSQGMAQAEARANARLALMLAIGELQKSMGPDQRISARAETLAKHPAVNVKTVQQNTAKAWWVGVSHSDPGQTIGSAGQPVVWLVSGLNPTAGSAAQISQNLTDPEPLYSDKSIDTAAFTGGQPIEAGKVGIRNLQGQSGGKFAWFVDDNGMKAQLAATNSEVRNDRGQPYGGGVLPGTYNLGVLDQMGVLKQRSLEDYNRLLSLNDLPLIGVDRDLTRSKKLGYTTRSQGVLADVRKGGLKKDLTIAFERDNVFNAVFPRGSGNAFGEKYIVMDRDKFNQCSDLKSNGYIHWKIFKDYYNLKKYIRKSGSLNYLETTLINKSGILASTATPFARGQLGPHKIGPNSSVPSEHQQLPYGNIDVIDSGPNRSALYRHNPVTPILSRLQENAWLDLISSGTTTRIETNTQLWSSQYNPYNITLRVTGDDSVKSEPGSRIITYPQIQFTIPGIKFGKSISSPSVVNGFSNKLQTHVSHAVMLGPGRAHVFAYERDGYVDTSNTTGSDLNDDKDGGLYNDNVKDLLFQSIRGTYDTTPAVTGSVSLQVDFVETWPSLMHGANSDGGSYPDYEVAQVMWVPFAYETIGGNPGKRIRFNNVPSTQLNENTMASFAFKLRSTRESGSAIRPLIDSNVRALLGNTRWDSPLGLTQLAAYSAENQGVVTQQIPQMSTVDAPKGYTYWGAGDDPASGYDRVILFDVPREDLVSLGQLQHASAGRFSYEPTYIVGNSYANLRIPQNDWKSSVSDAVANPSWWGGNAKISGSFDLYDASYLVNEGLWDSYIFTTIPQVADNYVKITPDLAPTDATYQALLKGDYLLPNPRFMPYEPDGSKFNSATLQMTSSSTSTTGGFHHNAGHLLVDGSFNVNSTSVDAWEAFLSGTNGLPYQKIDANGAVTGFVAMNGSEGVRFPRVKSVFGAGMDNKESADENYWVGFRKLKQSEVRELAGAIVAEIKKRGPFLTLGEFVNRKLESGELGQRGALQAALDATVNKGLDGGFEDAASQSGIPNDSTQGAGFPGQLLQSDVLQSLSPAMTVHSDTFTIRAYGESLVPGTNEVRARAWCEATVQRYPDPVKDSAANSNPLIELTNPTSRFGRDFRIVSFRWLNANEV